MKNAPYWTALIAGVIIIIMMYIIMKRKENGVKPVIEEKFVDLSNIKYYEGDKSTIPYKDKLYIYLSSFSGMQSDHSTAVYSGSGVPMWRSLINEDVFFSVIGTNLPTTIEKGLPMKGTRLVGPPSENAAFPNTGYVLPSFTVAWYANWKSLEFETSAPIILFRMFAENPNHVQISLREVDASSISLDVVVGNASNVYSWTIPKTTLISQGAGTLYSFIYNREEKKISFNIGSTIKFPRVLTESAVVKLGNTAMDINFNQNWDADLKAFMFYRGVITDFNVMFDYLGEQASGKNLVMSVVETEKASLTETLKSCSLNDTELAALRDELNLTREQLYNIRLKLRSCMQSPENIDPNSFRRWEIKDGVVPGKYASINQCTDLNVNRLSDIKAQLARTLVTMFAKPLTAAVASQVTNSTTKTQPTYPPTLHTTFPNSGFKTNLQNKSIYVATPYPKPPASKPPTTQTTSNTEWALRTLRTQFGTQQTTAAPAKTTSPAIASPTSSTSTSTIPEASLLPRPQTSVAGVKLLYADPSNQDKVTGAELTSSISYPTTSTSASVTTTVTPSTTTTTATGTAPTSSILSSLKSLFG